jgi:hypothetical protein
VTLARTRSLLAAARLQAEPITKKFPGDRSFSISIPVQDVLDTGASCVLSRRTFLSKNSDQGYIQCVKFEYY